MKYSDSIIYDVSPWVDGALACLRHHFYEHLPDIPADQVDTMWTDAFALRWVIATIDDVLNDLLEWAEATENASACLEDRFLQLFEEYDQRLLDEVNTHALRPVWCAIVRFIAHRVVDANPWRIWHIERRGPIVFFEAGEDYRIDLFNRKVKAGEWSLE